MRAAPVDFLLESLAVHPFGDTPFSIYNTISMLPWADTAAKRLDGGLLGSGPCMQARVWALQGLSRQLEDAPGLMTPVMDGGCIDMRAVPTWFECYHLTCMWSKMASLSTAAFGVAWID